MVDCDFAGDATAHRVSHDRRFRDLLLVEIGEDVANEIGIVVCGVIGLIAEAITGEVDRVDAETLREWLDDFAPGPGRCRIAMDEQNIWTRAERNREDFHAIELHVAAILLCEWKRGIRSKFGWRRTAIASSEEE